MIKRPMLFTAAAFAVCISVYWFLGLYPFIAGLLFFIGIAAFLNKSVLNILLFAVLFSLLLFSVILNNRRIHLAKDLNGNRFTADFVVCSENVVKKNNVVTVRRLNSGFISNGMTFNLYSRDTVFEQGEIITVDVTSIKLDEESFDAVLLSESYGRLWLNGVVSKNGNDIFNSTIAKIRRAIKSYYYDNLSYNSFATITAILLGDKTALSQALYDSVKRAGVSHIMAVSGMHLSVIMGILFFFAERAVRQRHLRFILVCGFVFFICAVCGFTPSVVRAGTMFVLFAVPPLFNRVADRVSVLCLSVVLILLKNPLILFNVSFQMSVFAVLAVMIVAPFYTDILKNKCPLKSKLLFGVTDIIAISVFAQIFTAPFSVYRFRMFSAVATITNLVLSFAVTLVLQLVLFALIFSFWAFVSGYLLFLIERIALYIDSVIIWLGNLKYAAFEVPKIFCIIPAAIAFLLTAGVYYLNRRKSNALRGNDR